MLTASSEETEVKRGKVARMILKRIFAIQKVKI